MKTKYKFRVMFAGLLAAYTVVAAPDSGEVKNVVIVANDTLKLSVTHIEAEPGQKIHIELRNESSMPKAVMAHNWVLLKPGKTANGYATMAVSSAAEGYQPKNLSDEVIASIPLLGPKETGEVTFEAPMTPGRYEYLCSFPAHCAAGMRGELIVK